MGGDRAGEVKQDVEAGVIAPVQVFDDKEDGLRRGVSHKELDERVNETTLLYGWGGSRVGRCGDRLRRLRHQPGKQSGELGHVGAKVLRERMQRLLR